MRCLVLLVSIAFLMSCENHAFDKDARQILAKDEISRSLPGSGSLTFTGFREDTLQSWRESHFRRPIRYTMDFTYKDSTGTERKKQGMVIFLPGNALVDCQIIDH